MSTILITGGAGFIGSNFIRMHLHTHPNTKIINLDKLSYAGHLSTITDLIDHPNHQFIQGDIANPHLVEKIFSTGIDAVVNFAAESHVDRSIEDSAAFIASNISGVHVLLEASRKHGIRKFVQISTDEVYGSLGPTGLFREDTHLLPSSPYSASKASADLLVQAWHHTYNLNVNITRCSNNYGPYQFPEKLIPLMISRALDDLPLPVYGDGSNIRDWIHVDDHCRAILAVLERGKPGHIYNIGASSEQSNLEVVKTLLNILAKEHSLISFVQDRLGHDWRYAIDSTKIQNDLGWSPRYKFSTGLQSTIQWYLNHQAWWQALLHK